MESGLRRESPGFSRGEDVKPLEGYFERIRQAYGIELVGTVELGDMWNETDGKEDHGRQSRDGEDDYDAG